MGTDVDNGVTGETADVKSKPLGVKRGWRVILRERWPGVVILRKRSER